MVRVELRLTLGSAYKPVEISGTSLSSPNCVATAGSRTGLGGVASDAETVNCEKIGTGVFPSREERKMNTETKSQFGPEEIERLNGNLPNVAFT